jgi:hypothetical protein
MDAALQKRMAWHVRNADEVQSGEFLPSGSLTTMLIV